MKNAFIATLVVSLLIITSCIKPTPNTDGSWTFKSVTYSATSIATTHSGVTVFDQASAYATNYQTLSVNFHNMLPTTGGTFLVRQGVNLDSTNQVSIAVNNYGTGTDTLYQATGSNGTQTVQVTVSSTGQLSISGSGIILLNGGNSSDSSAINFSIAQPQ
jgi:hypothetical protein